MSLLISRIVDRIAPTSRPHHDILRTRAIIVDRTPDPARGDRATFVTIALADPWGW